ncbi:uncharacterized protein PG998_014182 [Apiospora kogelbergensis]|uniref:uncharacterized protein n=1 Tax=Apiospora kogelbergensis TaxID=1337665 RepID=UPI00312E6931
MTHTGVSHVLRYAFDLARRWPRRRLTSVTKSNGIFIAMPYWNERVAKMAKEYPDVSVAKYHIDIRTVHFVRDSVSSINLFGNILSGLGPACTGTIGLAPSVNLNPRREGGFPEPFRARPLQRA